MPVGMEDAGVSPEEAINTTVSFIYWALIINYLLLIWISYSRGKKNNRKYIATFPLIGFFFDIVLAFIFGYI